MNRLVDAYGFPQQYHVKYISVLVWSLKLSNVKHGQYLDDWTLGNTKCYKLGTMCHVMVSKLN